MDGANVRRAAGWTLVVLAGLALAAGIALLVEDGPVTCKGDVVLCASGAAAIEAVVESFGVASLLLAAALGAAGAVLLRRRPKPAPEPVVRFPGESP